MPLFIYMFVSSLQEIIAKRFSISNAPVPYSIIKELLNTCNNISIVLKITSVLNNVLMTQNARIIFTNNRYQHALFSTGESNKPRYCIYNRKWTKMHFRHKTKSPSTWLWAYFTVWSPRIYMFCFLTRSNLITIHGLPGFNKKHL